MGIITRDKFKDIKRYDRQQMERFLEGLYLEGVKEGTQKGIIYQKSLEEQTTCLEAQGFEKGVAAAQDMYRAVMDQSLDATKGIGEKTKALFISNFNSLAVGYCEKLVGVMLDAGK